ncbi:MAG: ABC transporter ATP-binding protein [Hyphomicrobiaceae bacterium]
MALLDIKGLDAWYGRAQILSGLSLAVDGGEVAVLLGRNGAGKSTTLKAIMGLEVERRGSIQFAGVAIDRLPVHEIARLGLGYVPEERRIFTSLTVDENLAVGRLPARVGHAWTHAELFRLFPNLAEMGGRSGGHMSGGEQQMLTIARALMGNPRFLLLDEPSEGLAPVIVESIARTVVELKQRGVGMLVSEQNTAFARNIADRVYVIERGEIVFSGTFPALEADARLAERHLAF